MRVLPLLVILAVLSCDRGKPTVEGTAATADSSAPLAVRYDQHIFADAKSPSGATLRNPFAKDAASAAAGEKLFASMNCDGCHGGGATGWVAPSLSDGRWRYGGSDAAVYQSIYYGRPKGMPAFGGLLAPGIIWKLVTYIQSLPVPASVPTQAW